MTPRALAEVGRNLAAQPSSNAGERRERPATQTHPRTLERLFDE
jgi:hypothetical protein